MQRNEPAVRSPPGDAAAVTPGFLGRLGAALAAPRRAVAFADSDAAAGRTGTDAAVLIGLTFVAVHLRELSAAAWLTAVEGLRVGGTVLLGTLSRAIVTDLAFLLIAGVGLTLAAGRKRQAARDFDLACVAFVPVATVKLVASIALQATTLAAGVAVDAVVAAVAYGWAAWVLVLAWQHARRRPESAPLAIEPRRRVARAGLVIPALVALLVAINGTWVARNLDRIRPISPGDVAPGFSLPVIDEHGHVGPERVSLAEQRGKVVLVEFWATWCGPCRRSLPMIQRLWERYRDRGLVVIGVNTDDPEAARELARELGLSFPMALDPGPAATRYGVSTIPHMVVVDRLGLIRAVHRGGAGEAALEAAVRAVL